MLAEEEAKPFPAPLQAASRAVPIYGSLKQRVNAEVMINRAAAKLGSGDEAREVRQALLIALDYALVDMKQYEKRIQDAGIPALRVQSALSRGKLDEAEAQATAGSGEPIEIAPGVGYIAACKAGDDARSASYLADLLEDLRKGDLAHQSFAHAIEKGGDWETLRLQAIDIEEKRVLLTVLGLARPELRAGAFDLARTLNIHRTFPYLLIRDTLAK